MEALMSPQRSNHCQKVKTSLNLGASLNSKAHDISHLLNFNLLLNIHLHLCNFFVQTFFCPLKIEYHHLFLSMIFVKPQGKKSYDEPQRFTAAKFIYISLTTVIPQVLKLHGNRTDTVTKV